MSTAMSGGDIAVWATEAVVTVVLRNPDRCNAISTAMWHSFRRFAGS